MKLPGLFTGLVHTLYRSESNQRVYITLVYITIFNYYH